MVLDVYESPGGIVSPPLAAGSAIGSIACQAVSCASAGVEANCGALVPPKLPTLNTTCVEAVPPSWPSDAVTFTRTPRSPRADVALMDSDPLPPAVGSPSPRFEKSSWTTSTSTLRKAVLVIVRASPSASSNTGANGGVAVHSPRPTSGQMPTLESLGASSVCQGPPPVNSTQSDASAFSVSTTGSVFVCPSWACADVDTSTSAASTRALPVDTMAFMLHLLTIPGWRAAPVRGPLFRLAAPGDRPPS